MKTYTTDEGLVYCSNCGNCFGEEPIDISECGVCQQIESWTEENQDFENDGAYADDDIEPEKLRLPDRSTPCLFRLRRRGRG